MITGMVLKRKWAQVTQADAYGRKLTQEKMSRNRITGVDFGRSVTNSMEV